MSNFNPQINETPTHSKSSGYGRIFCNYPVRRVDYEINQGVKNYQFDSIKYGAMAGSLDPRPETRDDGILNQYDKGSPIRHVPGYSTPYSQEDKVQDRVIPLNNDIIPQHLSIAPSESQKFPVKTIMSGMPRVAVPNPEIPVYNHLIPYEYVTQFGECPCEHKFQKVEHVWSNSTKVNGFDPRLAQMNSRRYTEAIKNSRPFPKVNVQMCSKKKNQKSQ